MKEQIEELAKKLRAYCYDIELKDNDDCRRLADFILSFIFLCAFGWLGFCQLHLELGKVISIGAEERTQEMADRQY